MRMQIKTPWHCINFPMPGRTPIPIVISLLLILPSTFGRVFNRAPPTISLKYGTFEGMTSLDVDYFLGIPFAQATWVTEIIFSWKTYADYHWPRRFGLPQPPANLSGTQSAIAYGAACPQQPFQLQNIPIDMTPTKRQSSPQESEDCLFINVLRPAGTKANAGLPVLFVS